MYVHLPFCVVKCTYCDFYSVAEFGGRSTRDQDLDWVLQSILIEAERRAPKEPVTVFLGGGTPSIHSPEGLAGFLDRLHDVTGFRDSAVEVTMESNPESLDLETAQAVVEGGVNRISIGVQSFEAATLELFDRAHGPDEAESAYRAARDSGVGAVNVDLIYGSPGQDEASLDRDLQRLAAWKPDHVSAYSLAYEKGTMLTKWREQGTLVELAEEPARERFQRARHQLSTQGLRPYEVSNFTSKSPCFHNLNAWWNGPYIGLGPSAVSAHHEVRFGQARSVNAWKRALDESGDWLSMEWEERLPFHQRLAESWWLGLRVTEGVDPRWLAGPAWEGDAFLHRAQIEAERHATKDPSVEVTSSLDPVADDRWDMRLAGELIQGGWLERAGHRIRVAEHAWPVVDALARKFLEGAPPER